MKTKAKGPEIKWRPTEKQELFLSCPADEVLYGGAAGGGKSDAILIAALGTHLCGFFNNPKWRALLVRRTFPELEKSLILKSMEFLHGMAKYDGVKHRWVSRVGGIIQFGHIKNEKDVYSYRSDAYNYIGFDELTQFTEVMYTYLFSRLRTTDPNIKCEMRSASNPGGIGHAWVKRRFLEQEDGSPREPNKLYYQEIEMLDGSKYKMSRCFIPATVFDNEHLYKNDPMYVRRLMELPDVERKAMLYGDWNIYSGQFFTEFTDAHICDPFEVPMDWPVWISMDWGYSTYGAVGFYTQSPEGRVYMWDEMYFTHINPREVANEIKSKLGNHIHSLCGQYADVRIKVQESTSWSTEDLMNQEGLFWTIADRDRVNGWHRAKELLGRDEQGRLKFQVFNTCRKFIELIPAMIFDMNNPEDMVKRGETHVADQFRYFAVSRRHEMDAAGEPSLLVNSITGYPGIPEDDFDLLRNHIKRLPETKNPKQYMHKNLGHIRREA